jgi:hypothetical protein
MKIREFSGKRLRRFSRLPLCRLSNHPGAQKSHSEPYSGVIEVDPGQRTALAFRTHSLSHFSRRFGASRSLPSLDPATSDGRALRML